ncbi:hypothetical protein QTP88_004970 [Uroleucon formosanum]
MYIYASDSLGNRLMDFHRHCPTIHLMSFAVERSGEFYLRLKTTIGTASFVGIVPKKVNLLCGCGYRLSPLNFNYDNDQKPLLYIYNCVEKEENDDYYRDNARVFVTRENGKSDNDGTKYYYYIYYYYYYYHHGRVEIGDVVCATECELVVAELIRSGPFNPCRPHNGLLTTAKVARRLITAHSASLC